MGDEPAQPGGLPAGAGGIGDGRGDAVGPDAEPTYGGIANIDHVLSDAFQGDCWTAGIGLDGAEASQVFLVAGSSMAVRPAGALPEKALMAGARLIIVNDSPTRLDGSAHALLRGRMGEILPALAGAVLG